MTIGECCPIVNAESVIVQMIGAHKYRHGKDPTLITVNDSAWLGIMESMAKDRRFFMNLPKSSAGFQKLSFMGIDVVRTLKSGAQPIVMM